MANTYTAGFRLVRCQKCLSVLPEPVGVTVYRCGACNATLQAKVRARNGQNVATKQVRQESYDYSVTTSTSNGLSPENKHTDCSDTANVSSCTFDAPSSEHQGIGTRSHEIVDVMSTERRAMEVGNTANKEQGNLDGQNMNARMEGPADPIHADANGTQRNSDKAEINTVEGKGKNSVACRGEEVGDMECRLNVSDSNAPSSKESKTAMDLSECDRRETKTESDTEKEYYTGKVQSRSYDLQEEHEASAHSTVYQSARNLLEPESDAHERNQPCTRRALQSKSFRASEPLQEKILKTVDDLRGNLSELFDKPVEGKPRTRAPRAPKQESYTARMPMTSSLPLTAYRPAVSHSGSAARPSKSGLVAPCGLPSRRYRRHSADSYCHNGHMRRCPHDWCQRCQPPCCRPRAQKPALQRPPVKDTKRRPPPRYHCRPVLRGSPFVICSCCFKLVQLPTDFVVPGKGVRKLQCGSCSEVLSYSYKDPSKRKSQPSTGDDQSIYDSDMLEIGDAQYHTGYPQADPVSYSEDYGLSFGVSHSTEDEQRLNVSRNSSFNTIDERNYKESRLHQLMGYSSASELLHKSPDLYESLEKRTPNARPYDRKGKGICMANGSDEEDIALKRSRIQKGIHGLEAMKITS